MTPLYGWEGPGKTREMDLPRATTPDLEAPTSPDGGVASPSVQLFRCTVPECGRKFKKAMIVARHFSASHSDLGEDGKTWREFVEEVWE